MPKTHLLKSAAGETFCGARYSRRGKGDICDRCLHEAIVASKPSPPPTGQIKPATPRRGRA